MVACNDCHYSLVATGTVALTTEEARLPALGLSPTPSREEEGGIAGPCEEHELEFLEALEAAGDDDDVPYIDATNGADFDTNVCAIREELSVVKSGPQQEEVDRVETEATSRDDSGDFLDQMTEDTPGEDVPETYCDIIRQVLPAFLIAGTGMVCAGLYLDLVQEWKAFKHSEIVVLVPALLGLKGNLEMTLASRLSTEANLGHMKERREKWSIILGNLALVQSQAIIVGLLAAILSVLMVAVYHGKFNIIHALLVCSCGVLTASVASLILGVVTAVVIVTSYRMKVNPDNIATPIAASLGDITSLFLLSWIATWLYDVTDELSYMPVIIIVLFAFTTPFWVCFANQNKYTRSVLTSGWSPVIAAMGISIIGGLFLDVLMSKYPTIAVFQPVINGVGGNLVSVLSSRLSTCLHRKHQFGHLPPGTRICISPFDAFCSKEADSKTARVLMSMVVPGHLIFTFAINYMQTGKLYPSIPFLLLYISAAVVQVGLLLYLAYVLTYFFWSRMVDPDNATIPYLTSLGDVLGIILLGATFEFLSLCGVHLEHNKKE
ncbi:solute carrier family 41 member 1-like [Schistocerca serialis cubense]|uniref:solute carrier family 41 member 1-like n=1 Tax=Schistocerca serialis cubense TaxID=2023355 RepID=UPI00214E4A67|nr:solute carrier family 41 member 1-like [Schistocerca serialis cubense]